MAQWTFNEEYHNLQDQGIFGGPEAVLIGMRYTGRSFGIQ